MAVAGFPSHGLPPGSAEAEAGHRASLAEAGALVPAGAAAALACDNWNAAGSGAAPRCR